MPYSSGTFSRVHDFTSDRDAGIKIQASRTDAEFDGIATALSTAILKDGTQTTTAVVPFAFGISIVDNKAITLGTNSDITIQYDETTNDSLEIAAAVEGAALGIVLKSDQGDDNADQHKLSIADGGTLTLASKISGSFVTYLTHTPNSTVASSTLAVAGNLTVGGNLTLGSGAELSEAELEMLDGITAGTVAASKAVVVDANKDIASFRNITLTGELDAGSLEVSGDIDVDGTSNLDVVDIDGAVDMASTLTVAGVVDITDTTDSSDATGDTGALRVEGGVSIAKKLFVGTDADIDGTLEADAITVGGTALNTVIAGVTVANATTAAVATTVTITDNESTNEDNAIIFTAGGDVDGGNIGLESDGDLTYNPSTGRLTATQLAGTLQTAAQANITSVGTLTGLTASGRIIVDDTTDATTTTDGSIQTDGGLSVVKDIVVGDDIKIGDDLAFTSDGAVIYFGADSEVRLYHDHNNGLKLYNDNQLQFGDSGTYIHQSADGVLDLVSDTEIEINATTVDINGAVDISGTTTINDKTTITTDGNTEQLKLVSTDADANEGPLAILHRNSSSPADGDSLGRIYFSGQNDADEEIQYVRFQSILDDASDSTEDSSFRIQTYVGGAVKSKLFTSSTETVFNDDSADLDFRVESDGNANMLFVDGGNNEVGIGTNTPSGHGSPNGAKLVVHGTSGATMIQINATASNQSSGIEFTDDAATGQIHYHHGSDSLTFTVNGTQHFSIASNGDLTATDTSISSISDERLKTNIKDYTYDLEVFKKFKPKTFDWKNPKEHGDKSNVRGFIAQDILDVDNVLVSQTDIEPQTAVPNLDAEADLIAKDSDGKRLSYTSKLNGNDAMYISVIQQLIARIEALESK
jgi:hypothetical protein